MTISTLRTVLLAAGSVMSLQLSAQSEATESAPEQPAQQQTEQAATAQTDSVRVTELQEIIVRGKRGWFENDKAVFVPTRQEKNISTTIESFLQNMSLPVLVYKENSIESRTGESISYYINGRPVSAVDVKTFWAKLAKRVEYYEHPLDPRYNGEPCVINFIMDEYEAGGITRGYASQNFPGGGFYTLSSKLEYKRMTFGLMLDGNVSRDHRGGSEGTEIYRDLFYDGVHYDQITREMDSHSWSRKNAVGATLSARYYTEKFQADHSVALSWNQNPGSGSRSTDLWSPNLFNSLSSETSSSGISVSPKVSGRYQLNLKGKKQQSMVLSWSYEHSHNNYSSMSQIYGLDPIYNRTREDVNSLTGRFGYGILIIPNRMVANLNVSTSADFYDTRYLGSTDTKSTQKRSETSVTGTWSYRLTDAITLSLSPGMQISYWKSGNVSETYVHPRLNGSISWRASSKFSAYVSSYFQQMVPKASQTTDVMIRESELLWLAGNPVLKNSPYFYIMLGSTWMPSNWLNMSPSVSWSHSVHNYDNYYTQAPADLGGLIRTPADLGNSDDLTFSLRFNFRFFGGKLRVNPRPDLMYTHFNGPFAAHTLRFRWDCQAYYSLGNFQFYLDYRGKSSGLLGSGLQHYCQPHRLHLGAEYGNGNLNIGFSVNDILHSHSYTVNFYDSPHYYSGMSDACNGRSYNLNVTYTFGYGKKMQQDVDFDGASSKTGVVGR